MGIPPTMPQTKARSLGRRARNMSAASWGRKGWTASNRSSLPYRGDRSSCIAVMVRTAEPQRRMRSLVRSLARSQKARIRLGSSRVVETSSGNSSSTRSKGSLRLADASVSNTSSQSRNGRLSRSRSPASTSVRVSLDRMPRSSWRGRATPGWKIVLLVLANSWRSAGFPTRRRPQTRLSAPERRSHQSSRARSSSARLTNLAIAPSGY